MNKTILIIPDGHVDDEHDLSRWDCLGRLIVDRQPDRIVQLGDFMTIQSLSHFDMNKKRVMEGRRFALEMAAGRQALSLLFSPLHDYNEKMKQHKRAKYKPEIIWCEGNHEARISHYLDVHPTMEGQLELHLPQNLDYARYDITTFVPFKQFVVLDGIAYTHAPINAGCSPVQGKYALQRASEMFATSLVFGHLHRKESLNIYRHGENEQILQFYSAGCFFEHTDDYAEGAQNSYWRGIQILHQWAPGRFDVEEISVERLRSEYK